MALTAPLKPETSRQSWDCVTQQAPHPEATREVSKTNLSRNSEKRVKYPKEEESCWSALSSESLQQVTNLLRRITWIGVEDDKNNQLYTITAFAKTCRLSCWTVISLIFSALITRPIISAISDEPSIINDSCSVTR